MSERYRDADRREHRRTHPHVTVRRTFDTSLQTLLRVRAVLHVCLPLVVLVLASVIFLDAWSTPNPAVARYLVYAGYLVFGYFVVELGVDFVLYKDKRAFFRDRWFDIALLVPVIVVVQIGAWLGGLILVGRALRAIEFATKIGFEAFAIDELTVAGSRLQRLLKLFRKGRSVLRPTRTE
jgi:hypothetical protein